jgi:predicted alpha/beta-hydrolase family hydrolase
MTRTVTFEATKTRGEVSGLLLRPEQARWMLVFAHGAGAGMRNTFMDIMAATLAARGIATFRYHFPYMEAKTRRPDPRAILLATVRSAAGKARELAPDLPLIAGGKSMGGRMTSGAASEGLLEGVRGLVFFGFPLHPPGAPSTERADHLADVNLPMLFLQGDRDAFADLSLLKPVCKKLGRRATLHIVDSADHSFHVPKASGKSDGEVLGELAAVVGDWCLDLDGG